VTAQVQLHRHAWTAETTKTLERLVVEFASIQDAPTKAVQNFPPKVVRKSASVCTTPMVQLSFDNWEQSTAYRANVAI
jgi:hypothetical protein